jgi:hypothetical protein
MAIHLLTARQVQAASAGDHADGGGLVLKVRDGRARWLGKRAGASRWSAGSHKRKRPGESPGRSCLLAPRVGIEPTTCGLTVREITAFR